MGCDPENNGGYECSPNELPLHTVYLDAYYIDKYEVTDAQYAQCVAAEACMASTPDSSNIYSHDNSQNFSDLPATLVNWYQARNYCSWVGKRLPTEAEWEKAARGGSDTRAFPWGNQSPDCTLANFNRCIDTTSPIGNYPSGASPFGIMDMAGNVWEWANDWWDGNYYDDSPGENPPGGLLRGA